MKRIAKLVLVFSVFFASSTYQCLEAMLPGGLMSECVFLTPQSGNLGELAPELDSFIMSVSSL